MATAPALLDLHFPGKPPIALPRPINDQLGPSQARALHLRAEDQSDCFKSDPAWTDTVNWERWTGTAWLEESERQRVLAGLHAAVARLRDACARQGIDPGNQYYKGIDSEYWWERASAAASGDLGARLVLVPEDQAPQARSVRR